MEFRKWYILVFTLIAIQIVLGIYVVYLMIVSGLSDDGIPKNIWLYLKV